MTKLYLLRLNEDTVAESTFGYDIARGFVVRALSPHQARTFASECCGDEGPDVWLNRTQSTCKLLTPENAGLGVVLRDFRAG